MSHLPAERERSAITGNRRRVGFELEFAGLDLDTVADCLANSLPGTMKSGTRAVCTVETEKLGNFRIELDWQLGKVLAEERLASLREETGLEHPDDPIMAFVTSAASQIVPMEVVCPPIEVDQMNRLDDMVSALRAAGAVGTRGSPLYAFGVHINPELPDIEPRTIVDYLKAFCIAQDWLVAKHEVDLSRRVTPYINLYPKDYLRCVINYTDDISIEQIIGDYLQYNPTRNRALDMTPLFKHLDPERIDGALADDRINARPTFHYRLPNCNIEETDWSLAHSWSVWCVIEYIAADPDLLKELSEDWIRYDKELLSFDKPAWHQKLEKVYKNLSSA